MGAADLRDAFNAAAAGKATAAKAFHAYQRQHDVEYQQISFTGTMADGLPFTYQTPMLRPGTDLLKACADGAADLLKQHQKAAP